MKIGNGLLLSLIVLIQIVSAASAESSPAISCGQTITVNTTLDADLACPAGTGSAITIGASNITLDLGGHTISGDPLETGIMVNGPDGITIRNGTLNNFKDGIFLIDCDDAIIEQLTINNLAVNDTSHFIFGVHLYRSHNAIVRHMQFEFLSVAHKEAVEVHESDVEVSHIAVQGGGAGVGFSFVGSCDPVNRPSNGSVLDSTFSDIAVAGIWVACTSDLLIEGNEFTKTTGTGPMGIQGDAPVPGAATGMIIRDNLFHTLDYGIELRGIMGSTITSNLITHNQYWGIMVEQSQGCLPVHDEGWECFNSTGNSISDNFVLDNGADLYQQELVSGNTWERNVCRVKVGDEIPDCIPPAIVSLPLILRATSP